MKEGTIAMGDKSSQLVNAAPVLKDCCARAAQCRLHQLHSGLAVDATFHSITTDRIVVHVGSHQDDLQAQCLCCIAFPHQQSLYAFLGCVKHLRDGTGILEVHFDVPASLTMTNLRSSYRVPVVSGAALELSMRLEDGTVINAEALNASESGIEVNLPSDDDRLSIDVEVQLDLKFRDDRIAVPAIVRRRQQSRRALQFVMLHTSDARPRMATLQRIVRSMEQVWLKSRRG